MSPKLRTAVLHLRWVLPLLACAWVSPHLLAQAPTATPGRETTPAATPAAVKFESPRSPAPVSAASTALDPASVAKRVDAAIVAELSAAGVPIAPRCSDEDYLRRVSFDIAGISPEPADVTLFGLDPDPHKRAHVVDRLLHSSAYAQNWSRYWRDVLFLRSSDMRARIAQRSFESWMAEQLTANRRWNEIATGLLTATGDVLQQGQTALMFLHSGEPEEIAGETSRIFLGIQIQCANCHDHPTDQWKRKQFHELAAFFPRIRVQPKMTDGQMRSFEVVSLTPGPGLRGGGGGAGDLRNILQNPERFIRFLDKNNDQMVSREEATAGPGGGRFFNFALQQGDTNKDGLLSADEIRKLPIPDQQPGRGAAEYRMPDLNNPQSPGTQVDPAFFLTGYQPGRNLGDLERRESLARVLTAADNPWFSKALVNRLWAELLGEGFYMPIDDIGPERTAVHPAALDVLSAGFTASGYDLHWLFRTITRTEAYQRQTRARAPSDAETHFAAALPSRLRADQLYDALSRVLGIAEQPATQRPGGMPQFFDNSPRGQFQSIFGFDPSTLPDDITGTIPQALFLMNSPPIQSLLRASGRTRLAGLLQKFPDDTDALVELYLLVHAREPSERELDTCRTYLKEVGDRATAYEDLLWALLNSTEFQTKR